MAHVFDEFGLSEDFLSVTARTLPKQMHTETLHLKDLYLVRKHKYYLPHGLFQLYHIRSGKTIYIDLQELKELCLLKMLEILKKNSTIKIVPQPIHTKCIHNLNMDNILIDLDN